MVDLAYLQGYKREDSKALYFRKEIISGFQWLTALFLFKTIFVIILKSWLLAKHGVDGYYSMIIALK